MKYNRMVLLSALSRRLETNLKHMTINRLSYKVNKKHRNLNGGLDKYYTPRVICDYIVNRLMEFIDDEYLWIEPSAGSGVFIDAAKRVTSNLIAYDISPERDDILQQDFLTLDYHRESKVVVFGNPPFGFKSSMAVKFFNKAAEFADFIAFVLPATFMKQSIKNSLDTGFDIVFEERMDINFEFPDYGFKKVPCIIQFWKKSKSRRVVYKDSGDDLGLFFVKDKSEASVAIRRVGSKAGKILDLSNDLSKSTTYFIDCDESMLQKILNTDFSSCINNTAGVRSLSKPELFSAIRQQTLG